MLSIILTFPILLLLVSFCRLAVDVRGIITQPDGATLIAYAYTHLPDYTWDGINIDFNQSFPRQCVAADYATYVPGDRHNNEENLYCLMGAERRYQQRLQCKACYNGPDFFSKLDVDETLPSKTCECNDYDYQCSPGYYRTPHLQGENMTCLEDPEFSGTLPSKRQRKIPGNLCGSLTTATPATSTSHPVVTSTTRVTTSGTPSGSTTPSDSTTTSGTPSGSTTPSDSTTTSGSTTTTESPSRAPNANRDKDKSGPSSSTKTGAIIAVAVVLVVVILVIIIAVNKRSRDA